MQPYFFPYIGYWQLIKASDTFVIFDDVNFKKKGWINRNLIYGNSGPQYLTLPLKNASQNHLIKEIEINETKPKFNEILRHSYTKAPQYERMITLILKLIYSNKKNLADYLELQIREISCHLEMNVNIIRSSDINYDKNNDANGKVLEIASILGAKTYINLPGGRAIYDPKMFEAKDIELSFISTNKIIYPQKNSLFIPNLSIIDVFMFNSAQDVSNLLNGFELAK